MKNVTLRVEEEKLSRARQIAAARSTSVNALIRDYLDELIELESRHKTARQELVALCQKSTAQVGKEHWTRESLYDR